MPIRPRGGVAATIVSLTVLGTALPALAAHADSAYLYVSGYAGNNCSDSGTGTQAQPFCSIQAAADAAQPGQTVLLFGEFDGQTVIRRSGTPEHPITFTHANAGPQLRSSTDPHVFTATGVHDIVIKNITFGRTPKEAVLITDSDRVTVTGNTFTWAGVRNRPEAEPAPGIRLTGKTTGTTISRNRIGGSGTAGIAVDAGVAGTVITTNAITASASGAIVVTDAPGTVITSNSIADNCHRGIELAGDSSGASIKNNIITHDFCNDTGTVELAVSADSATGTKVDHNVVYPAAGATAYTWGGAAYASPAELAAATGQGVHDLRVDPKFSLGGGANEELVPTADTAAMDSADESAPGQLDTDLNGTAAVDDPVEPDTGTGSGHRDRGAFEYQNPFRATFDAYPSTNPGHPPQEATITGEVYSPWHPAVTTLDFGDGSAPVVSPVFPLTHAYAPGSYTLTLTSTDGSGASAKLTRTVGIVPAGPIEPSLVVYHNRQGPAHVDAGVWRLSSPWPVSGYSFDFGDGTPAVVRSGPADPGLVPHDYTAPGSYPVKMTVTDDHGRSAVATGTSTINFAVPGDIPVAGRWASGKGASNGMFNSGSWVLRSTVQGGPASLTKLSFGQAGDLPAAADWDGVGHDQLGIYRNGLFAVRHDDGSVTTAAFGAAGDLPVPGPWDHNGHAQLAIYRPSSRTFAVRHDDGSVTTAVFGDAGDVPVVGDWDGVGHTQLGIFRPSTAAFALRHDDGSVTSTVFGSPGDVPLVGDWFTIGRTTWGVYRPSMATYAFTGAYTSNWGAANQLY
ncbi:right-handed parallel beta-helix repeat-containing protein [Kitasatospora sp. NPDC127111]|uniref:right-handed parallel beta-helix repeat-containing protein n=1 Tax=Kitasatospora sp. NPDC127111 TaxID=3345363 RepID=UPI0036282794